MKLMAALFTLLMTSYAVAQISVNGIFIKASENRYQILSSDEKKMFPLLPSNRLVATQLQRLQTRDALRGTAVLNSAGAVMLHTLDFVGLHSILGEWRSSGFKINFRTFSEMSFYSQQRAQLPKNGNYRYALTPGEGSQWKLFISDSNKVLLASLTIVSHRAMLTFYDEQGKVTHVVPLTKSPSHIRQ